MGMMEDEASFSRSGQSGSVGKNDNRVTADVDDKLRCDIGDALEMYRAKKPTATRAEMLRNLIDEELNGCITAILHVFPDADSMSLDEAEAAMALLGRMSVEDFRRQVMAQHIFGRLHLDSTIANSGGDSQPRNDSEIGTARLTRAA